MSSETPDVAEDTAVITPSGTSGKGPSRGVGSALRRLARLWGRFPGRSKTRAGGGAGRWWPRSPLARWLLAGGVALCALLALLLAVVGVGVFRIGKAADAREEASVRVKEACGALETRLNRLVPPGATSGSNQRADAIRDENAAVEPLIAELDRLPDAAKRYRSLRADVRALLDARERYAGDLDGKAKTGRAAFFVLSRDDSGTDRVERIIRRAPDTCDAAVRRLAAPDL